MGDWIHASKFLSHVLRVAGGGDHFRYSESFTYSFFVNSCIHFVTNLLIFLLIIACAHVLYRFVFQIGPSSTDTQSSGLNLYQIEGKSSRMRTSVETDGVSVAAASRLQPKFFVVLLSTGRLYQYEWHFLARFRLQ